MTKRALTVSFLLGFWGLSCISAMQAEAESFPSSVELSWSDVPDAVYYDIYSGEKFIVRLEEDNHSYTVGNLFSDKDYSFSIAARTAENETLDAAFVDTRTTSWDGIYEWINRTDKNNHGKVKSIKLRIDTDISEEVGQYHNVYMYMDDGREVKIFPLYEFGDPASGKWVDYSSSTPDAISYRLNAERFNISPFDPSKWRVDKVVIDYDSSSAYIQTSAMGLVFETVSGYELYIEDGVMKLSFYTEGSGMVDGFLFKNPNPGEGDAFILTRIE